MRVTMAWLTWRCKGHPSQGVLNCGGNSITCMDPVTNLANLKALVLNDNDIVSVPPLKGLPELNTLVLSHNQIEELGNALANVPSLTKLSLSNNQLTDLGGSLRHLAHLTELRLAHNQLSSLPDELQFNRALATLDIGGNRVTKFSSIKVLGTLKHLRNLNLKGNPLRDKVGTQEDYTRKVLALVPSLQILDGHRLDAQATAKAASASKREAAPAKGATGTAMRDAPTEEAAGNEPVGTINGAKSKRKGSEAIVEHGDVADGSSAKGKGKWKAAGMDAAPVKEPDVSSKVVKGKLESAQAGTKPPKTAGVSSKKDAGSGQDKQAEPAASKQVAAPAGKDCDTVEKAVEEKRAKKSKAKKEGAKVKGGADEGVDEEGRSFLDMVLEEGRKAGVGMGVAEAGRKAAGADWMPDGSKPVNIPPAVSGLVKVVNGPGHKGVNKKKGGPQVVPAAAGLLVSGDGAGMLSSVRADAIGLGGSSAWDDEDENGRPLQADDMSGKTADGKGHTASPHKRKLKPGPGPQKKKKRPKV
eukprot:jgi/Mesvir1/2708/Mv05105-RA.1